MPINPFSQMRALLTRLGLRFLRRRRPVQVGDAVSMLRCDEVQEEKGGLGGYRWKLQSVSPGKRWPARISSVSNASVCLAVVAKENVGVARCNAPSGVIWHETPVGQLTTNFSIVPYCLDLMANFGTVDAWQCGGLQGNQLWSVDDTTGLIVSASAQYKASGMDGAGECLVAHPPGPDR